MMQVVTCSNCGRSNPSNARFCQNCGHPVTASSAGSGQGAPLVQPVPSFAAAPAGWSPGGSRAIGALGERMDGWGDLIEEAGDKCDGVVAAFQQRLLGRQIPEITHEAAMLTTGAFGKKRPFQLTSTRTGATLAVYIAQFGRDLYVSWDLFIRPLWNTRVIATIVIASVILSLLSCAGARNPLTGESYFLVAWFSGIIFLSFLFASVVAAARFLLKRNPLGFFIQELDAFDADDIAATMLAVHRSLLNAIDSVGDAGDVQKLTTALDQLETTSVGRHMTESLRTSQTTIEFGPTKDGVVAEHEANTITINDQFGDASPAVLAAHLAHEGTHQRLGTPSSFADALNTEYRCHVVQAETWNALKGAEHDDQCDSVAEMVARGEAAAKAELLRRYGSAYFVQRNS